MEAADIRRQTMPLGFEVTHYGCPWCGVRISALHPDAFEFLSEHDPHIELFVEAGYTPAVRSMWSSAR